MNSSARTQQTNDTMSNRVCPSSHIRVLDNFLRPVLHRPKRLFGPYVKAGDKVLDIGCGGGFASIGLARLVGDDGEVVAADIQPEMLEFTQKRAQAAGLSNRIKLHQSNSASTGLEEDFDFILAFWMAHETPDPSAFLEEVFSLLKPKGYFFLAEPKMHVSDQVFRDYVAQAEKIGFTLKQQPFVLLSRAAVLARA